MSIAWKTLPTLLEGWNRKGWKEGIHYVTDKRPSILNSYKPVEIYKHTISLLTAVLSTWGRWSTRRISCGSYQHMYGDEAFIEIF
jgi:hypothetical protein